MIYYKHIEIRDFELIQEKTRNFLAPLSDLTIGFHLLGQSYMDYCPEILTAFSDYNLNVKAIAFIVTSTQDHSRVHIDYKSDQRPLCRINIPILNCEGSRTEFYVGGEYNAFVQKNGISYYEIKDDTSATKVAEVELIKPTVIRVQEPHRVQTNLDNVPRICMTVTTDIDPVFFLT